MADAGAFWLKYLTQPLTVDRLAAARAWMEAEEGEGVVIEWEGTVRFASGFGHVDGRRRREVLKCDLFQAVPCTMPPLVGFTIWCDDEGLLNGQPLNPLATELLGAQVLGGMLYGPIIVQYGI